MLQDTPLTSRSYELLRDLDDRVTVKPVSMEQVVFSTQPIVIDPATGKTSGGLTADFGDGVVIPADVRVEQLAEAYRIPTSSLEMFSPQVQARMLKDRSRQNGFKGEMFNWGIDQDNGLLEFCGPADKPHVPFTRVGQIFEDRGFNLDGELARHGNGRIIALHPAEGVFRPRVDDIVQSGAFIEMNPLMNRNPFAIPWSERLVCTNGMTTRDDKERILVIGRTADDVLEQFDLIADDLFRKAEELNDQFGHLIEDLVVSLENGMDTFVKAQRPPKTLERILISEAKTRDELWDESLNGPRTWYDVINIYTRVVRDVENDDSRLALQSKAGTFTTDQHARCRSCGTDLR